MKSIRINRFYWEEATYATAQNSLKNTLDKFLSDNLINCDISWKES